MKKNKNESVRDHFYLFLLILLSNVGCSKNEGKQVSFLNLFYKKQGL